ncbi:MAG: flagellar biosynthetic protein FliR [Chlamydiota bacterium]
MLDYFSTLPNMPLWSVISLFLLILLRFAPVLAMAPFLGAKLAPGIVRMGLAVFLSIIFLPYVIVNVKEPVTFNHAFILYSAKELLIGLILGFFVTVPFYIVQTSGIIVDYLRGASIMQSQDPSLQTQTSPIGIFYNYTLIVIFFQISGPFLFFDALLKSYEVVPPAEFINPLFFSVKNTLWQTSMDIINQIVAIAIQLSAPCIVSILMAEMFLGIANRLAPQVQIAFLGMSIKSLLGLALLWTAWFFILKQFTKQTHDWLKLMNKIIAYMKYMIPS